MAQQDFDIDSLAAYLHLTPQQVMRMADRGRLPGRKVGGDWRFSQAEMHHWLEDKIGASGEGELVEVEEVLDRAAVHTDPEISIQELLPVEAIDPLLEARTRGSVITAMTNVAAMSGMLWDPERMADAVRERENLHPTALDNGAALLHPRRPIPSILAEAHLALGRTSKGIPFGGGRGNLTDLFFLICSTDDRLHLRLLARLSRLISDGELLQQIRHAVDAVEIHQCIAAAEANLDT